MIAFRAPTISEIARDLVVALVVLGILMVLLFPPVTDQGGEPALKSIAKNDVTQLATAITAFRTEYGVLPGTNRGVVGGDMLAALLGGNDKLNPRKLVFLEINLAKKGKSGLTNGVFVDPWGAPYQIAFDGDYDGWVSAGTNNVTVKKCVAVWSDPRLGTNPSWFQKKEYRPRYVTSWD